MKNLIWLTLLFAQSAMATTFIVEMKHPLSKKEIEQTKRMGMKIELFDQTKTPYFQRTYRVESQDSEKISNSLPVKLIEPIHRATHFSLIPKKGSRFVRPDELFNLQWGLLNQEQQIKKLINNTRTVTYTGKSQVDIGWEEAIKKVEAGLRLDPLVAVVDMGIDLDHPELKDRIYKNMAECNEKGEATGSEEDKDKNGLKGDCMGWNFTGRNLYEAQHPYDDDGHGTHVAGIIAAESNKVGISGVSSRIKILPIRVTGKIDETADRKQIQPLTDRIAQGILYAANMNVDVINLSLGWTRSMDTKYLREAMTYALSRGIIIVAAAGNNNNNANILPCSNYDVICVGAVTVDGSMTDFSNYGGEVDVLAPGDEIVSTYPTGLIPLQLNVQGYDIKSGTSQAAPFVSAVASLLRGNFPRMHRDDVIRRITESAGAGISGKSMNGIVNLKGAFELPLEPAVRPIFKNFSLSLYDGVQNKFNYPFKIKNFGPEAKSVVVKIKSLSPAFKLDQEFPFEAIKQGEVVSAKLIGDIVDPSGHNQIKLEVIVSGANIATKTYVHETRLARDILRDDKIITMPFEYLASAIPVGVYKDGVTRNLINTTENVFARQGMPEFYIQRAVKETGGMEIRFFRQSEDKFKEVEGVMTLPQATQLLNVMKLDINMDGVDDYLVRVIACEKDCETPEKSTRYIQYTSWTSDLKPLFGAKSLWKFLPTIINVDLKSQRFMKINHKEFGTINVPVFVEQGPIPDDQQDLPTAFSLKDKSVLRRIYFLSPVITGDKVDLATQTVSTTAFNESIRVQTKAAQSDEIQVLYLLNQGIEDFNKGIVRALISVGKGYLRRNIEVVLSEGKEALAEFSIKPTLWGHDLIPSQHLSNNTVIDAFTGMVSSSRINMLQTEMNTAASYSSGQSVEVPLATIAAFADKGEEFTFFQTPSYLMVAHHTQGSTEYGQLKINRFSFLPGTLFNDSFYPVVAKGVDHMLPALYVDETDIQSNLVSLTVFDKGELKAPLKMSAFIPPVCKAMNPARLTEDEGHSLALLCLENKQWVMKFSSFSQQ